jgi:ligand-binding sensor domain-containing protein
MNDKWICQLLTKLKSLSMYLNTQLWINVRMKVMGVNEIDFMTRAICIKVPNGLRSDLM